MSRRRRIVLVSPFAPAANGRHGGARAFHGLAGALAQRNDVALLHLDDGSEPDPAIVAACAHVETHAVVPQGDVRRRLAAAAALARGRSLWSATTDPAGLQRHLRRLCRHFRPDVVQVEFGVLGAALRAGPPGALRILTVHDPAGSRHESVPLRAAGHPLLHRLDAWAAVREEHRNVAFADAAVAFTARDLDLLGRPGETVLARIPLGCDVPAKPLDPAGSDPRRIVFIGNYRHPPNVDAALTLATRVLPLLRRTVPDATLDLVGAEPPERVTRLAGPGVEVTGAVPDVRPYLDRAAVVAVPIRIGGGMRVKVLEALAAGKAVAVTPRAAEGIDTPPRALVVADGDAALADAIARLLEDRELRVATARAARQWAVQHAGWSAVAERYEELYRRVEGAGERRSDFTTAPAAAR